MRRNGCEKLGVSAPQRSPSPCTGPARAVAVALAVSVAASAGSGGAGIRPVALVPAAASPALWALSQRWLCFLSPPAPPPGAPAA